MDHWRNQRRNKKYLETNESTIIKNLWDAAKAVLEGRGRFIAISQETREISNKQPNLTSQATRETNRIQW